MANENWKKAASRQIPIRKSHNIVMLPLQWIVKSMLNQHRQSTKEVVDELYPCREKEKLWSVAIVLAEKCSWV